MNLSSEVAGRIVETGVPLKVGQKFKKRSIADSYLRRRCKKWIYVLLKAGFLNKLAENLPDIKVDYVDNF